MGYHLKFRQLTLFGFFLLSFITAGCANNSATQAGANCSVTGTPVSGSPDQATLAVSCGGGTAPYNINSLLVGGITPSVTGATTGFSSSTTLTISNTAPVQGLTGTATISDSSGAAPVSFSFTIGTTGTVASGTGCTITPSTSTPGIGQTVQFNMVTLSGWGTAPYTFSTFSPGASSTITQNITSIGSNQAQAQATYSMAEAVTATVNVTDATGILQSCSTALNVGTSVVGGGCTGTGCALSCYLSHTIQNNTVIEQVTDSNGLNLTFVNFNPGSGGSVYNNGNPMYITYGVGSQVTIYTQAYSPTTGAYCNGGQYLTDTFTVSGGNSGNGLTCIAVTSVNPSLHGQAVVATPIVTGAYGTWTFADISYPNTVPTPVFSTSLPSQTALLTFPFAGPFPLIFIVQDSSGRQAQCSMTQNVQ